MTIIQLATFLKVSEMRSFTAAANSLGYAQSTVTTQIKQLEEELGCPLFERLGKSVVLTSEGERLGQYAEKMMQLEREILMEVPAVEEPSGVLKLGVSESLCYNRLPKQLLTYRERCPKVDLQLHFIDHDTFPPLLRNGSLDVVYTLNPFMDPSEIVSLGRKAEKLGFYASPEHPLSRKKKVTEQDLKGVPLLLTSHNCSFRQMLQEDLESYGIAPEIVLETSSKEVLKQFAVNELGVAFMPDMVAEKELKARSLKRLNWGGKDFPVFSQIFIHKDKHRSKALLELVKVLEEEDLLPDEGNKVGKITG